MAAKFQTNVLYLIGIALISVGLSYYYGNEGIEAFYSVYIANGILLSLYTIKLLQIVKRSLYGIVVKSFGSLVIAFFWLIVAFAVVGPIIEPNINPKIIVDQPYWLIVMLSVIAYVFRMPFKVDFSKLSNPEILTRTISAYFSIVVLFIAFISFFGIESDFRSLILVLAVEFVYIANYIYSDTKYVSFIEKRYLGHGVSESSAYFAIFLLGLPFAVPIVTMLVLK